MAALVLAWPAVGWARADGTDDDRPLVLRVGQVHSMAEEDANIRYVRIEAGKIVAVGESFEPDEGDAVRVLDAPDVTLIPGLINAWSSSPIAGGDNERTREVTPDIDVVTAIDWHGNALGRMVAAGVTTVCVAPGTDNVIAGTTAIIKTAGSDRDRRVVKDRAGLMLTMGADPTSGNRARTRPDSIYVRQPTNRMGVVWMLRASLDQARRAPTASTESDAVAQMLSGALPAMVFSRTQYDITAMLSLAQEFGFQPTLVGGHEAYKVVDQLAAVQVPIVLAPLSLASSGPERTELVWNQMDVLSEGGIRFALSGDDPLGQIQLAVRCGMDVQGALAAVTSVPAELLGIEDRVGRIAAGLDADLVALNGDPAQPTTRILWVMSQGEIVYGELGSEPQDETAGGDQPENESRGRE